MFEAHTSAILELCRTYRLLDEKTLADLQDEHRATGKSLASLIIDLNLVPKDVFLKRVAEYLGLEYMDTVPPSIAGDIVSQLTDQHARMYGVVPLHVDAQSIDLLASDPFNAQIIDDLTFALRKDVRLIVADPDRIAALLKNHYGEEEGSLDDILSEMSSSEIDPGGAGEDINANDLEAMAGQGPIIRYVNLVLAQPSRDKASDIHF